MRKSSVYAYLVASALCAHGAVQYVDATRPDDEGDGFSWETAKRTIQAAVDVAEVGDTVTVTNGVYAPVATANKGMLIQSVNGASSTVIDGGSSTRCATLGTAAGNTNTTLVGFTLRSGRSETVGGGVYGGTLVSCRVTGNWTLLNGGGAYGGALRGCTLSGNSSYYVGGGADSCSLANCQLFGNSAGEAGGAYASTLVNCTLSGNAAGWSGGVNSCTLTNCIVWGNKKTDDTDNNYEGPCSFAYTCTWPKPEGAGNMDADPCFGNAAARDFRLRACSPCLDAGTTNRVAVGDSDVRGQTRIQNGRVDLGAFEGAHARVTSAVKGRGTVSPSGIQVVAAGGSLTFTATPTAAAFLQFLTNGVFASDAPVFTWNAVPDGGEVTAVFAPLTFYVDDYSGSDTNDGLSWETPKKSIQAAVNQTITDDRVIVNWGIFKPFQTDNKAIRIESVGGAGGTLIDGQGVVRCAALGRTSSDTNTVLVGFTLANGRANYGGGTYGGTLVNCSLSSCYATLEGGGAYGGTLVNCTIAGNSSYLDGGGARGSSLSDCTLSGNSTTYGVGGGAAYGTLVNCRLTGNSVAYGAGGGAGRCTLSNCTVTRNTGTYGAGVAASTLVNCIVWANTQGAATNNYYSSCSFAYTCTAPRPASGEGNISEDPRFVDAASGDFRLREGSPCIDAGTNAGVRGALDSDCRSRIINGAVDMGAYEALYLTGALADGSENGGLVWASGGDCAWAAQNALTDDGVGAARSGAIGDGQKSWLETSVDGKGSLSFVWRASSESLDRLRFYTDGEPRGALAGATGWLAVSLAVTNAGVHTFRWEYAKSKSGAAGEDAAWLDRVVWTPVLAEVAATASPVEGGSVSGSGTRTAGSTVTLMALPRAGWLFDRWENGDTNPRRTFTVPDDGCACTAYFIQPLTLAQALDAEELLWISDGDALWQGWALDSASDGEDAAQSGIIGDRGSTRVRAEVTGQGTLSFWWRVSCEEDCDYLDCILDGRPQTWITGESGWRQVVLRLGSGTHALEWEYWKDESASAGEDAAWLDRVVWTPDLQGFDRWAEARGLTGGASGDVFAGDCDGDGVANAFDYAFGANRTNGVPLLIIRMVAGRPIIETPSCAPGTTDDVDVAVLGTTNLLGGVWTLPVRPALDAAGKPADRDWFEPQGEAPDKAFFRLRATRK